MEGCAVATGRLLPGERSGILLLVGWLFAGFRGRNLGAQIMLALEQEARRVGGKRISLSAQCRASGFYQTFRLPGNW
ncbi:MAG: GNAT family N-acetyltransferase [Phascolarctobacterium faecium]